MNQKISVGGQALIEGVLMKAPGRYAIVVRKEDGSFYRESHALTEKKTGIWSKPLFRGIYALYDAMKIGINALNVSASIFDPHEDKMDRFLKNHFPKHAEKISFGISLFTSLLITILFFVVLPTAMTSFLRTRLSNPVALSAIEGLIKITLFFIYLLAIRQVKEVKRVFMYHGAEHKAVFTFESGEELTVENARKFPRLHPRCGTSYIFFVLAISILFYSFVGWTSIAMRIGLKIVFLPLVAAIGFEVLKGSAKSDSILVRALRKPGLWLQRITTAEPDDSQLEVALESLKLALDESQELS